MDTRPSRIAVAVLGAVLLAAGCSQDSDSSPPMTTTTTTPVSTSTSTSTPATVTTLGEIDRWVDGTTMIVWIEADVDSDERGDLRRMVEAIPGVDVRRFVGKEEAYAEFESVFADDAQALAVVSADRLPTSFRLAVDLDDPETVAAVRRLSADPRVREIVEKERPSQTDLILELACVLGIAPLAIFVVWMQPSSSSDENAAVTARIEAAIENGDGIVSYSYVDQEATYAEFQDLFADEPQLLEVVTADVVPPSYRIEATDFEAIDALAVQYERLAGVRSVVSPDPDRCADL